MKLDYPFSAIVGQKKMKQALILTAIDPLIGGVLVFGERGTGKSTIVRSLTALLPEIKSIKVSNKNPDRLVLGADSVISLNNELINKPKTRDEALKILKKLNNSKHYLICSACIAKNGSMIWNHTDTSELKMKNFSDEQLLKYLNKIKTETLLAYGVYQIEAEGLELFEYIKGDINSIMGLPVKNIINYIKSFKK